MDFEQLERTPVPEPKVGEENVTIRLSGSWLKRWHGLMEVAGDASKSDVMREFLSLGFAVASLDGQGEPIQVIVRRNDEHGRPMPEIDVVDLLELPTFLAFRKSRSKRALGKKK